MPAQAPCPPPERLRDLLDGCLPEPDQRQLVRHLDDCAGCQQALEGLAANAASWSEAARLLTPEGSPDPRVTAELPPRDGAGVVRAVDANGDTISLSFLGPPREAGHVGRLGHYEVLEVVGSGGSGIVLKAFDEVLHRVVAIKVMTPQLAAVASARKRFSREARAAAAVTHEHVVTIHAVEDNQDTPFIVMQYVAGVSLQERIDRTGPMQVKEILRIGMQAAQGLAAAHAQGLIHRDVKPANILLENGVERVKLTDFGLARMADDASVSQSGVIAGTPLYMAPEQARGEELDARADLFSLGSVLYAMCTGHPPFRAGSPLAVLRRVCEETPRPVREVNPDVPDWLAEIVAKLHEKDPARRFQSTAEVADLLGRHLAHLQQPATVPAPARLPRQSWPAAPRRAGAWKWVAVAAGCLVLLAGVPVLAVVLMLLWVSPVLFSKGESHEAGPEATMTQPDVVEQGPPVMGPRQPELRATLKARNSDLRAVAFSPDGKRLVAVSGDKKDKPGAVELWDATALTAGPVLKEPHGVRCAAFSPDSAILATGEFDNSVKLRDPSTGAVRHVLKGHDGPANAPGKAKPVAADATGHSDTVTAVVFTPDGKGLVTASLDGTAKLWGLDTRQVQQTFRGHTDGVLCAALSRDGKVLATGGRDRTIRLWDVGGGQERWSFGPAGQPVSAPGHLDAVESIAFAPGGPTLATGCRDGTVGLWDTATGRGLAKLRGHAGRVSSVAWSPDGRVLASGGTDGEVKLWDVAQRQELVSLRPERVVGDARSVAFSHDGRTLAAVGWANRIYLWDLRPPAQ